MYIYIYIYIQIRLPRSCFREVCKKVVSDSGLGGGFHQICQFHPPFETG